MMLYASDRRRRLHGVEAGRGYGGQLEVLECRRLLTVTSYNMLYADARSAAATSFYGSDPSAKDGPLSKVGYDLSLLYQEQRVGAAAGVPIAPSNAALSVSGDRVQVEVLGQGSLTAFEMQLTALGGQQLINSGMLVTGSFPISRLDQLAAMQSVIFARPLYQAQTAAGSVVDQGDQAMRSDLARNTYGFDGSGVTVGVISDSFNTLTYPGGGSALQHDIQTGDLPANTQILDDLSSGTDEGRALAQVVHDIAPGAAIRFATGSHSPTSFANNIRALASAGASVIVDDVFWNNEPFFQDGVIAQAIRDVVNAGVTYFTLAGNHGDASYQSAFSNSGVAGPGGGVLHDFDSGSGVSTLQHVQIPVGSSVPFSFQWDQPFRSLGGAGATSDLDFYILGADKQTVVGSGTTQNIGGDALELTRVSNSGNFDFDNDGQPDTDFYIEIELVSGPAPNLIKYIALDNGAPFEILDFATHSSTVYGHANTDAGRGVGASAYFYTPQFGTSPPLLNDFSSLGGTPILFDASGARLSTPHLTGSPQLVGPDSANTTFFGTDFPQDSDSLPNFAGTSASAPHVAAVAALMIQAAGGPGTLTPQRIYDALESTAIDIVSRRGLFSTTVVPIENGAGIDNYSGHGLVDAFAALQLILAGFAVNDVALLEGDNGTRSFVFTVSTPVAFNSTATVAFTTADGTALAGSDYLATSGTLTFLPGGPLSQTITVQVIGDYELEPNETFFLRLSDATNANITRSEGVGTILNDDVDLHVSDVSVVEGNTGTRNAVFTVYTVGSTDRTISVNYTTVDDTAKAGTDYQPRAGLITFGPGGGSFQVSVPILVDRLNESTENFRLILVNPTNAHIADGEGVATITDDDPLPSLYVNDVHVTSNESNQLTAIFTVALDTPSGQDVSVGFTTADNSAIAGTDYLASSGTLVFAPGVTTQNVTVTVMSGALYSGNKTFWLNLFSPLHATLGDAQGVGSLIFATPQPTEFIMDDGDGGYGQSSGWTNLTNTLAYGLDYNYHAAGNGSGQATWTFANIPTGNYQVFAKWIAFSNRATNAPYTVFDGANNLGTVLVNQQAFPAGEQSNGVTWQSLGMFSTSTGTLSVRLGDNANGYVIADAIRLVKDGITPQRPEMDVAALARSITSGDVTPALDDGTDYGDVSLLSSSVTRTFTISNNGNATLNLTGSPRVQISGPAAQDFTVVAQPTATVGAGYTTTFQIMFDPSALGLRQAVVSIANDDDSENPYTFVVQGNGVSLGPTRWIVDDSSPGFTRSGAWETSVTPGAYQGQMLSDTAGGSDWAKWVLGGLAPGKYDVYATWAPQANAATNAAFKVADGAQSSFTSLINQRQAPAIPVNGTNWASLGSIDSSSGTLTVTLTNAANGPVMADAVMIVRHDAALEEQELLAHNAALPLDVNGDTRITSLDALLVISELLAGGDPQASALATSSAAPAGYYRDVNGDGAITPRDALLVISYLINPPAAASAVVPSADTATTVQSPQPDAGQLAAVDAAVAIMSHEDLPADDSVGSYLPVAPAVAASPAGAVVSANPWAVASVFDIEEDDDEAADLLLDSLAG